MDGIIIADTREVTKEQWLKNRNGILGGSDASAILGLNPYKSNLTLYREKIGLITPEDIGYKPYVKYGNDAESPLIKLFSLDFPRYQVTSNTTFKIHRHPKYDFIGGTLDGELVEIETGRKGILEIKTTEILNSMHREKWTDRIPGNYFCQVCHYLLATGWDFIVLKAQLKTIYGDDVRLNTRHYHIERTEVQEDLDYLLEEEIKFWRYVQKKIEPPLVLPPL